MSAANVGTIRGSATRFAVPRFPVATPIGRASVRPDFPAQRQSKLLEQAIQNLATNAGKYNRPDGWIRFDLGVTGHDLCLRVSNSGRPIPPADHDRIFERFYRADPSRSARVGGAGLGLSLAREIIRAHGGELNLAGSADDVTCFIVKLPVAPPAPA